MITSGQEKDDFINVEYRTKLLERQNALQLESDQVLADLKLIQPLSSVGNVERTGSSILGLMVWPDIDLLVLCLNLNIERILLAMIPIFANPQVDSIQYRHRNPTNSLMDERYYFHAIYKTNAGKEWKIDIAFWRAMGWGKGRPYDYISRTESIKQRLTDEAKIAILWIKDVWYCRPEYSNTVFSKHIYDAVLNHNVRTPSQFEDYLNSHMVLK